MPRRAAIVVLALVAAAGAPRAQESRTYRDGKYLVREVRGTVSERAPRLAVETDLGSVTLRGSPGDEVRYVVRVRVAGADDARTRRRLDDFLLSVARRDGWIRFRGQAARDGSADGPSAEFDLTVPRAVTEISLASGAGDVGATGVAARATLLTRGGRIAADDLAGPLRAASEGGNIEIGAVRAGLSLATAGGRIAVGSAGGDVEARTSGGDIMIGRASGKIKAETSGGNISIEEARGDVDAATSGGGIRVGSAGGRINAATAGGSIRVASAGGSHCETAAGSIHLEAAGGPVRAVTSAGSIQADLSRAAADLHDSDLQTWQGDVTVVLPETLPVTIRALVDNPLGRSIRSEFPLHVAHESEGAGRPMEVAEGRVGGGGSVLTIRTLGGTITILKARNGK
jgi:DUF4097 and DUF4098 domain-containing protein YvlB